MVETHLNNLDDEMIPLLKKAGLELVYVGVESSSHVVLKAVSYTHLTLPTILLV